MLKRMKEFDEHTKKNYGDVMNITTDQFLSSNMYPEHNDEPYNADSGQVEDIYVPYEEYEDGDGPSTVPEVDDIKYYDLYMEAEAMLPRDGDHRQAARVVGVTRENEGQKIGEFSHTPILITKVYNVMFPGIAVHQYTANTIAENIYYQEGEAGCWY